MAVQKPFFVTPEDLTIQAVSSEAAGHPATMLTRADAIGLTWQTSVDGIHSVRGQFLGGTSRVIDFCSLVAANAQPGTLIRLRMGDSQNDVTGESLLLHPREFDDASWFKQNAAVTANNLTSPALDTNADTLASTVAGGANTAYADQMQTVTPGLVYTFSVYMKQGTSPISTLNFFRNSPFSQSVATITWGVTPTMVASGADLLSSGFEDAGGGWYRVWLTMNSGAATQMVCRVYVRDQGTANVSGHTVGVWLAQLRQSDRPAYDSLFAPLISPSIIRSDGLYNSHLELPFTRTASWWQIEIKGHTGTFEASTLILGKKISSAKFYDFDYQYGIEDTGEAKFNRFGVMDQQAGVVMRTVQFALNWQTQEEWETLFRPLAERVGTSRPVYLCFDPEPTIYRQAKTYLGLMKKAPFATGRRNPKFLGGEYQVISVI